MEAAFRRSSELYEPALWNPLFYDIEHPWYVQMPEAGTEVARVELKEDVDIEHYANVPAIGSERLEIAFIDVATSEYGPGSAHRWFGSWSGGIASKPTVGRWLSEAMSTGTAIRWC